MKLEMQQPQIEAPSYDDSSIIKFGLSVIFIVFVLLGGWSAYAPLASNSVASGKVSADLDKKTIQHLEGGKVTAIFVQDGDVVKKGQQLVKLRDVQIKAQLDILQSQYQDTAAMLARLAAQKDELEDIAFPSSVTDEKAMQNQIKIFVTKNNSLIDERNITASRVAQLENKLVGYDAIVLSKKQRLASVEEEKLEWNELFKQRLVDKQRIRDLQRESDRIVGDIASATSEIQNVTKQIGENQTQQLLREKDFQTKVLQQFVEVKSNLSDLESKIIATADDLDRTNIIAPIDGTVVGFTMHTVGGVIAPGNPILEIVPLDAKLIVVAQVQIADIDKVVVGLEADVMFSAFNLQQTKVIKGKVIHVSADSFIDKVTGMPYYEAKIEVTKEGVERLKEYEFVLVSGMPADVMINIGDRTALDYLVKPFTQMMFRSFNEE